MVSYDSISFDMISYDMIAYDMKSDDTVDEELPTATDNVIPFDPNEQDEEDCEACTI